MGTDFEKLRKDRYKRRMSTDKDNIDTEDRVTSISTAICKICLMECPHNEVSQHFCVQNYQRIIIDVEGYFYGDDDEGLDVNDVEVEGRKVSKNHGEIMHLRESHDTVIPPSACQNQDCKRDFPVIQYENESDDGFEPYSDEDDNLSGCELDVKNFRAKVEEDQMDKEITENIETDLEDQRKTIENNDIGIENETVFQRYDKWHTHCMLELNRRKNIIAAAAAAMSVSLDHEGLLNGKHGKVVNKIIERVTEAVCAPLPVPQHPPGSSRTTGNPEINAFVNLVRGKLLKFDGRTQRKVMLQIVEILLNAEEESCN